jgi:GT2 family glycosyltransferase
MEGQPEVSVVVPSHERAARLERLLDALGGQTLARDRWEVVVVYDSTDGTGELLRDHPLAAAGLLRHVRLEPGTGTASRQRNTGWRAARADTIAFTDDDTRPDPGWLEHLIAAARANPRAIVQGRTKPDPLEAEVMERAPRPRSVEEDDPPGPHAQTCNILYPRAALEEVGGFDETIVAAGEDWDLSLRARKAGYGYVGEPRALVYHACEEFSLIGAMRFNARWRTLPKVLKRHPEQRALLHRGVFWQHRHMWLLFALAGVPLARRQPLALIWAVPWVLYALPDRRARRIGRLRAVAELPGVAAVDASEVAAMVAGSVRYRTVML